MDFSQFKTVGTGIEEPPKKVGPTYELLVTDYMGGLLLVRVIELVDGREVFRVETNPKKKEFWVKKCRKDYRPIKYDAQRNI